MQLHKCRILLVDDHAAIREAVRALLSLYDDVQVIGEGADGREAVDMAEASQPDVIVMDINMPRMNGIEAANLIRKSCEHTVIIGLCAVQDRDTMDAFIKAGATAVVSKHRLNDLHSTIQRACQGKASMRSIGP
jgi:DNA-binding NarL/FixJ family response regulator